MAKTIWFDLKWKNIIHSALVETRSIKLVILSNPYDSDVVLGLRPWLSLTTKLWSQTLVWESSPTAAQTLSFGLAYFQTTEESSIFLWITRDLGLGPWLSLRTKPECDVVSTIWPHHPGCQITCYAATEQLITSELTESCCQCVCVEIALPCAQITVGRWSNNHLWSSVLCRLSWPCPWGYSGGSPTAVQAWRPLPLWEPSHSHPIVLV